MIAAKIGLLVQLCLAGLMLGGDAVVLGPLATSFAFGAVLIAKGLLGGVITPEGALSSYGDVILLLAVLPVSAVLVNTGSSC